jgi:peptidoglycan/LPS O-acetylase OafA/YrhL
LTYLWSLAVEEHFYLFWPFMVWFLSERSLARACLAIIMIAPALRGLTMFLGQMETATYVMTQCRMDSLATGALLAVLVHNKAPAEILRRFGWIGLISGLLLVTYFAQSFRLPGFADERFRQAPPFRIFGYSVVAFAFASLICVVLVGGWTTNLMSWRPLRFFGVYSYGIYIYHGILLRYLMTWFTADRLSFNTGHAWLGVIPHYVLCISASTLIAVLSYHLLEKPFLKLKRLF